LKIDVDTFPDFQYYSLSGLGAGQKDVTQTNPPEDKTFK
jgi:hypothetical protein